MRECRIGCCGVCAYQSPKRFIRQWQRKLRRQVQRATGGFNRSEIARLLRISARAMTFNVDNLCNRAAAGNATAGPVVMMDSRNSLVRSDEEATFRRVKARRTTQAPLGPRGALLDSKGSLGAIWRGQARILEVGLPASAATGNPSVLPYLPPLQHATLGRPSRPCIFWITSE